MKLNKILCLMALSFSAMNTANAADQGHGKITFNGSIIESPCSISPESIDQTVELGQVSNVQLQVNNDTGTSTPRNFEIKLENCTLTTAKSVSTMFTGAEGAKGRLGITGTAKGASIVLTDGANKPIELGKASSAQGIKNGNNTLLFSAYLQGDGVDATAPTGADSIIEPGDFTSTADFTLTYQ